MEITRKPSVFINLEFPERSRTEFTVGNSGQSPAFDVTLEVEKDTAPWLRGFWKDGLREVSVFSSGISYLPPGRTLHFRSAPLNWEALEEKGGEVEINISYKDESGDQFERKVLFELEQYAGVLFKSFNDPSYYVAEAIQKAEQNRRADKLSDGTFGRVRRTLGEPPKKRCPICDENISVNAKKCSKCLEHIEDIEDTAAEHSAD